MWTEGRENLWEEGDENNEQFSNTEIQRGDVVSQYKTKVRMGEVSEYYRKGRKGTYVK
jgi:hypothetical protein